MSFKILIIGQLPPPYHGSNVMAKTMLDTLRKQGYECIFVDKSFSRTMEEVCQPSLRKVLRVPVLALEILIACLFRRPAVCIYFVTLPKTSFLIDVFCLSLLRLCYLPYILRFGGKGFRDLQNENSIWRFLVSSTFCSALGGIVKGKALKWDADMFIPDDRLVAIPNGIPDSPLGNQNKHKDYVQVLFLSNLIPSKGPLELLKAAKLIIQERQDIQFILAGNDWLPSFSQQLRTYVDVNGLSKYIKMPGGIYGEEKEELLNSSDIFVFPTRYETFGIVNLEAMRAGLPVISSSEGAIPEIVQDGVTGFIVNPKSPDEIASKLLILANDPDLRREMGMKGRKAFESRYTLKAYAKNLDDAVMFFLNKLGNAT